MHDWLKEHFTDFPAASARTVFNFVMWVRQKYQLSKVNQTREYAMVPKCPYGQQAQIDFGEYSLRNGQGRRIKVYFLILVLSRVCLSEVFAITIKENWIKRVAI